ncbi:zinc finger protein 410 isoform X1 [Anolis carolinensis]|uniref:Zinc finger protein 410 n=1 Tax=Anolis carolinensis TaxID=28377 RepID=G1KS69_ANOCA|nr:PREDICTED: zinc finger protein 410 isoform X1 [Anolis carolinensis]XP_008124029.1 PREDICTED: zinc finger protein 410 isoform X1 [Anolis carolinensis]|eukprot:XP_003214434.1 PREDICTED: zinc finger protein 410 isoform X1 [Anolis carolinensis]
MLSDELESKPELLVQFVQNTAIPLGEELAESGPKDLTCLSLLPVAESPECNRLILPDDSPSHTSTSKDVSSAALLRNLQVTVGPDGEETRAQTAQKPPELLPSPDTSSLLQDLQPNDSTSFILLNLTRTGLGSLSEHLVFVQDEAEDSGNDLFSNNSTDSSTPWFLRVQELAHDSLIAATRAQLAKNAKASNNGENVHVCSGDSQPKEPSPIPHLPRVEKKLACTVEGCDRTFVWPAHFRYHLKTHRNDRSFTCPAKGCGKSFYVLQRLKVHMRTHNGEKPFICTELGCGKQFTTAGNLKNHLRIHTGEKPFLCEAQGCGRSFAEYSSLRKHLVVHSGVKPHQCQICGKTFSQSGSRNVHMKKHHSRIGMTSNRQHEQRESLMGSSLLEESEVHSKNLVSISSPPSLGVESLHLPDTESIIGVKEAEVLAEATSNSLHAAPDVVLPSHHLMPMSVSRHTYGVSSLLQ